MPFSIFSRRFAGHFLEDFRKIAAGIEGELSADVLNTHRCGGEQKLCLSDFFLFYKITEAHACFLLELARKIVFRISCAGSEKVNREFLANMCSDIVTAALYSFGNVVLYM